MTWYLPADITIDHCIGAYIPRGASSYADSLINKAHPGTHNASDHTFDDNALPQVSTPGWNSNDGWIIANNPSDYSDTHNCLDTGITDEDITTAGTIIVIYSNLGGDPAQQDCTFAGSLLAENYDTTGWPYAEFNIGMYESYVWGSNNGYSTYGAYSYESLAGMLAVAGGHVYRNGAYDPITEINYNPPWPAHHVSFYIGAAHGDTFNADGSEYYGASYSAYGANCKIQAALFYDVALSQAQLDFVRLGYNMNFRYAAVLRKGA